MKLRQLGTGEGPIEVMVWLGCDSKGVSALGGDLVGFEDLGGGFWGFDRLK